MFKMAQAKLLGKMLIATNKYVCRNSLCNYVVLE